MLFVNSCDGKRKRYIKLEDKNVNNYFFLIHTYFATHKTFTFLHKSKKC